MTDPAVTVAALYAALEAGDGAAMAACYTPHATFQDPAFGRLEGPEVGAMWRMLTSRGSGVAVALSDVKVTGTTGSAHWVATYRFGPKDRPVVNDIHAAYRFTETGLIEEHVDHFDLSRWGAQAMGPVQGLLGKTPILSTIVQRTTRKQLDAFMAADQ